MTVTARYVLSVRCTSATGSRRRDVIGAQAAVELTVTASKMTLLTGSGDIKVSAELKSLCDGRGANMLQRVKPEQRALTIQNARIGAGRIAADVVMDGIDIEAACYLECDGTKLTHGFVKAEVTKFLWRFFVKTLEADFSGELVNKEILGS